MSAFRVVAEVEGSDQVRSALRALFRAGIDAEQVDIHRGRRARAEVAVTGLEQEVRDASAALARAGATRLRWTDATGSPLRGPGRARSARGWQRPGSRRLPALIRAS